MKRKIEQELIDWKNQTQRLPLVIRGARQVGKTYLVQHFGKQAFCSTLTVDFEQERSLHRYFDSLQPSEIIAALEVYYGIEIKSGETLLFFDEIQECPKALMSLRYFKEQLPEQHVIAAGSLLEFILNDDKFSMPVGRVEYLYLGPLSFFEYLEATNQQLLLEKLQQADSTSPLHEAAHDRALKLFREYMAIGGMPQIINEFVHTQSYKRCQDLQTALLKTYQDDFGKYASHAQHKYLRQLFERAPSFIAQWFRYNKAIPGVDPRTIRSGLQLLYHAGLLQPVYACSANGVPLATTVNEKKFKLLFLDIGLARRAMRLDLNELMSQDLMLVNRGALAEQVVGQELVATSNPRDPRALYFWIREKVGSSSELDYITQVGSSIVPIEVKAGTTGRLKALKSFINERELQFGVKISTDPLQLDKNILSVPLYLAGQVPAIIRRLRNGL